MVRIYCLIPLAGLAMAAPLAAQATAEEERVRFRYDTSEIRTAESAQTLFERIEEHARRNCRYVTGTVTNRRDADQCAVEIVRQIVHSIDSPTLTAVADCQQGTRFAEASPER